ncbi:MAG: hypothetical protein NXI12_13855 [Alphaproteobacteria bacterium]|nr:hypothetical protein [Alphaproteobacteria bacterium]
MRRLGVSALALVLAGCATSPADLNFSTTSAAFTGETSQAQTALLVLAIGGVGASGTYRFQRIDSDPAGFAGDPVALRFGGVGSTMMARPAGSPSNLWVVQDEINFLVAEVEPGLYAASYAGWGVYSPVSSGTAWHCQTGGAPTFEVLPGSISLVLSRDAYPPNTPSRLPTTYSTRDVLERFALVRAGYPGLEGEPTLITASHETRWTEAPPNVWVGEPCTRAVDGSVSINRYVVYDLPGPNGAQESDAALAAREAAMRLLEAERDPSDSEIPAQTSEDQPK